MAAFGPIGPAGPKTSGASASVRAWVRELTADSDLAVVVTELNCSEPGCPPIETVIALMYPGEPRKITIEKPLAQVTRSEVRRALESVD